MGEVLTFKMCAAGGLDKVVNRLLIDTEKRNSSLRRTWFYHLQIGDHHCNYPRLFTHFTSLLDEDSGKDIGKPNYYWGLLEDCKKLRPAPFFTPYRIEAIFANIPCLNMAVKDAKAQRLTDWLSGQIIAAYKFIGKLIYRLKFSALKASARLQYQCVREAAYWWTKFSLKNANMPGKAKPLPLAERGMIYLKPPYGNV